MQGLSVFTIQNKNPLYKRFISAGKEEEEKKKRGGVYIYIYKKEMQLEEIHFAIAYVSLVRFALLQEYFVL